MKPHKIIAAALAATGLSLAAAPALAQMYGDPNTAWTNYQTMRAESVSAEAIMAGDVTSGTNMLGNTRDLILNPAGTQIQYVLYKVPSPWSFYGEDDDGFVDWDDVTLERGVNITGVDVRITNDTSPRTPDQLTLTRAQAERRMLSNIIGEDVWFSDGAQREIEDVLFNPDTGAITHYVVQLDDASVFGSDARRIPVGWMTMSNNRMTVRQPATYNYDVWMY